MINTLGEKYHIFLHPSFTSSDHKQEGIPTSIIPEFLKIGVFNLA